MTREQLRTIADLVAIAHDEYDGCPSYRDDLERFDRLLAEIKAEERERAKYERLHECFWNVDAVQNVVRQMLDERDDIRDENPKAAEVAEHFARLLVKAATPAPGNTLKMRDALEWVDRFFSYDGSGTSTDAAVLAIEASTKTREALSAPARNCDRPFRSVDEALGAYVTERGDGHHLGYCDAIKWALAPAKDSAQ